MHALERTFARGCARPGVRLVHDSLQGSHAHLVVEAHDTAALGHGMKAIAARLAFAVNRVAGRVGRCSPIATTSGSSGRPGRCGTRGATGS